VTNAVMYATLEELAERGVAELSIERIARTAEVNKTTIYRRWPTKEALVAGAFEYVLVDFESAHVDTGSLHGDLTVLAETIAQFVAEPMGRALARAAFAESSSPELAALAQRRMAQGAQSKAAALVARATERGEWRFRGPPEVAFSMLVGAILHRQFFEHLPAEGAWLDGVVKLIATGLQHGR
jgi:AcrR family transcriptional regulator